MEKEKGTLERESAEPDPTINIVEGESVGTFDVPLYLATTHSYAYRDEHTAPQIDPLKGRTFIRDTYEVLSLIGRGGTSSVYKVRHQKLNRIYAAKVLNANVSSDPTVFGRFDREAKALAELKHENLIEVHDYGTTDDGIAFLIMDYLSGNNIEQEIERLGRIDEVRALRIFTQVCKGLEYAHRKGIVHRDLKPSNIMLVADEEGREQAKIVDFGIAKRQASDIRVTQTGEVFGTPLYMSPEQCLGTTAVDARSDIYSLGCVIYETLSGVSPFLAASPLQTILKHLNDNPVPLSDASCNAIMPGLESIVNLCLAKDPDSRPQTAAGLGAALTASGKLGARLPTEQEGRRATSLAQSSPSRPSQKSGEPQLRKEKAFIYRRGALPRTVSAAGKAKADAMLRRCGAPVSKTLGDKTANGSEPKVDNVRFDTPKWLTQLEVRANSFLKLIGFSENSNHIESDRMARRILAVTVAATFIFMMFAWALLCIKDERQASAMMSSEEIVNEPAQVYWKEEAPIEQRLEPEKPATPEELKSRLHWHLLMLKDAQKSKDKVKQYDETMAAAWIYFDLRQYAKFQTLWDNAKQLSGEINHDFKPANASATATEVQNSTELSARTAEQPEVRMPLRPSEHVPLQER